MSALTSSTFICAHTLLYSYTSTYMLTLRLYTNLCLHLPIPTLTLTHAHSPGSTLTRLCPHSLSHMHTLTGSHSPTPMPTLTNSMLTCAHMLSRLLKYLFHHIPPYSHFSQTFTLTQPFPSGDHDWSGVPFLSSSWIFPRAAHPHVLCFDHGSRPSTMPATLSSPTKAPPSCSSLLSYSATTR